MFKYECFMNVNCKTFISMNTIETLLNYHIYEQPNNLDCIAIY